MIRFRSLGSGSTGNATLIEARSGTTCSRVLVDCGLTLKELDARLARAGLAAADLDAVFITHEHTDHIGCASALARREGMPVWMSEGCFRAVEDAGHRPPPPGTRFTRDGDRLAIGDLQLLPYTVPHDAREPLQLVCTDGQSRLGILTDAGTGTPHLLAQLQGCHALLMECNHDPGMLARSRYLAFLKARIAGRLGHLSNESAAQIVGALHHGGLRHVVAAHLSEQNNTPSWPAARFALGLGCAPGDPQVADPVSGFDWLSV